MDIAQKVEIRRMTPTMWEILQSPDGRSDPVILPSWIRSANILAARGFLIVHKRPDEYGNIWHAIELTDAGREALVLREHRRRC